jgi:hypothetical protein
MNAFLNQYDPKKVVLNRNVSADTVLSYAKYLSYPKVGSDTPIANQRAAASASTAM